MFKPKKTKYIKKHKGRISPLIENKANSLKFGIYGIQALECGRIDSHQIEASRRAVISILKKKGKIWIRMLADHQMSSKPAETRMGKGKGAINRWVCLVKTGKILFEISGKNESLLKQALENALAKFSIKTRIIGPIV
jgi:large subunit ribosomal protein L16